MKGRLLDKDGFMLTSQMRKNAKEITYIGRRP